MNAYFQYLLKPADSQRFWFCAISQTAVQYDPGVNLLGCLLLKRLAILNIFFGELFQVDKENDLETVLYLLTKLAYGQQSQVCSKCFGTHLWLLYTRKLPKILAFTEGNC